MFLPRVDTKGTENLLISLLGISSLRFPLPSGVILAAGFGGLVVVVLRGPAFGTVVVVGNQSALLEDRSAGKDQ